MSTLDNTAQKRIASPPRTPRTVVVEAVPAPSLTTLCAFAEYAAAHDCAVDAVLAACPDGVR